MTKNPKLTTAQLLMGKHLKELGIVCEYELQFMETRKFRLDIYFETAPRGKKPSTAYGIEIDGGMWTGGHRHKKAIERDYEKANLAQVACWIVLLRFTNEQVNSGYAKQWIKEWIL